MCDIQESLGNFYLKLSEPSKAAFWFNGAFKSAGEMARTSDLVRRFFYLQYSNTLQHLKVKVSSTLYSTLNSTTW